jgi:hypothetical protein
MSILLKDLSLNHQDRHIEFLASSGASAGFFYRQQSLIHPNQSKKLLTNSDIFFHEQPDACRRQEGGTTFLKTGL